jgi:hypothetical protein
MTKSRQRKINTLINVVLATLAAIVLWRMAFDTEQLITELLRACKSAGIFLHKIYL